MESGTHCRELNGLARKILQKWNKDRVMCCLEYNAVVKRTMKVLPTLRMAILKVMRDIKLTAWRFILLSVSGKVLQKRMQVKSMTLG